MTNCVINIYKKLNNVDSFSLDIYNDLISKYGKTDVDNTISFILNVDGDGILSNKLINCCENEEMVTNYINIVLIKRVHKIISNLNLIFDELGYNDMKFNKLFLCDKIKIINNEYLDISKLEYINYLYEKFIVIRNKIVLANEHIIFTLVKKYYNNSFSFADVAQYALIGLINSVELYNPDRDVKFSTYAYICIRSSILNNTYSDRFSTYVPKNVVSDYYKYVNFKENLYYILGREPNDLEIANYMNVDFNKIIDLSNINDEFVSIYDYLYVDDVYEDGFSDVISYDYDKRMVEEEFINNMMYDDVNDAINKLSLLEKKIIYYRFYSHKKYFLEDIAKKMGITRNDVRNIYLGILRKLSKNDKLKSYLR